MHERALLLVWLFIFIPYYSYAEYSEVSGFSFHVQKCPLWCWNAGVVTLLDSQGVYVSQEFISRKVYGDEICRSTEGQWWPMAQAIRGCYDGLCFDANAYPGIPTNPFPMIQSIRDGRPFLFSYGGHIHIVYGVEWTNFPITQIVYFKYFDPFSGQHALQYISGLQTLQVQGWLEIIGR